MFNGSLGREEKFQIMGFPLPFLQEGANSNRLKQTNPKKVKILAELCWLRDELYSFCGFEGRKYYAIKC